MLCSWSSINPNVIFLSLVNFILKALSRRKNRTYDYTRLICGRDYVFEPVENLTKGYMTGQGKGIKAGDYIMLSHDADADLYQVEEIDYYSEPSDMWIALLHKVTGHGA